MAHFFQLLLEAQVVLDLLLGVVVANALVVLAKEVLRGEGDEIG